MEIKIVDSLGPLSPARLRDLEKAIGMELPDGYREFLKRYNGGSIEGSDVFRYKYKTGPYTSSRVKEFLAQNDEPFGTIEEVYTSLVDEGRLPRQLLPIAIDPFGNLVCISLSGDSKGSIYFWDEGESVHLVADSFQEFIAGLEPNPHRLPD